MLRAAIKSGLVLIATLSILPAAFMLLISWGQWKCGLYGLEVSIANLVAAIGVSGSIMGWRQMSPADGRISIKVAFAPWLIFVALTLSVIALAPQCPFPSR